MERAISVLSAFSADRPDLSLSEVTYRTGLSKPTVFRLLATLQTHHFVAFDPATGRYRLGGKVLELGGIAASSLAPRKVARPHLNQLQTESGATVLLGVLMDDQVVLIDKRDTTGPVRIAADIGLRKSPHFGVLGMVLMAHAGEGSIARMLRANPLSPHTPFSITDQDQFAARLERVRKHGYAFEVNEAIVGFAGLACPIRGEGGRVVVAVGVALPAPEAVEERIPSLVDAVQRCAEGISYGMGYVPPTAGRGAAQLLPSGRKESW